MATMIRVPGRTTKIAYAILGTPPNIAYKPSKKQDEINKRIAAEDTSRAR